MRCLACVCEADRSALCAPPPPRRNLPQLQGMLVGQDKQLQTLPNYQGGGDGGESGE